MSERRCDIGDPQGLATASVGMEVDNEFLCLHRIGMLGVEVGIEFILG